MTKKRLIDLSTLLLVLFFIVFIHFVYILNRPFGEKINEKYYHLPKGASATRVANDLQDMQIIVHPVYFTVWLRLIGGSRNLQAGQYELSPQMTLRDLAHLMLNGDVVQHKFTIIEGWNIYDLWRAILISQDLKKIMVKESALFNDDRGRKNLVELEGLFYPETYHFTHGFTDQQLLHRSNEMLENKLKSAWKARAKHLPYRHAIDALIVASLIEKEASLAEEKPIVAVFLSW